MAIRRIHTDNSQHLMEYLQSTLGHPMHKQVYFNDKYITFNFIVNMWFTIDIITANNSLHLTLDDFKYFIELHSIGVNLTLELILATLEELAKES